MDNEAKKMLKIDMLNLSELIQDSLMAVLDGLPDLAVNAACKVVVDNVNAYIKLTCD